MKTKQTVTVELIDGMQATPAKVVTIQRADLALALDTIPADLITHASHDASQWITVKREETLAALHASTAEPAAVEAVAEPAE